MDVSGVEPHVDERLMIQTAGAQHVHVSVDLATDEAHGRLGHAAVARDVPKVEPRDPRRTGCKRTKTTTTGTHHAPVVMWRRGWDLNPRTPEGQCLSRASHSAALAPLLGAWSIARYRRTRNGGRADECTRLESGRPSRVRGFESPPFRQSARRPTGLASCA